MLSNHKLLLNTNRFPPASTIDWALEDISFYVEMSSFTLHSLLRILRDLSTKAKCRLHRRSPNSKISCLAPEFTFSLSWSNRPQKQNGAFVTVLWWRHVAIPSRILQKWSSSTSFWDLNTKFNQGPPGQIAVLCLRKIIYCTVRFSYLWLITTHAIRRLISLKIAKESTKANGSVHRDDLLDRSM